MIYLVRTFQSQQNYRYHFQICLPRIQDRGQEQGREQVQEQVMMVQIQEQVVTWDMMTAAST